METHQHDHNPAEILAAVKAQCQQRGLRLTTMREHVLTLLANAGKPVKAYDLLDMVKQDHSNAAPPTVYRALDFLMDHGFVHRLTSVNAFVACGHSDAPHSSQFLICDDCGNTLEVEDNAVESQLSKVAESQGFTAQSQTVEVHGLCAECTDE